MAVEVKIKGNGILKKRLSLEEVVKVVSLQYGTLDDSFRLIPQKIGQNVIVYEKENIGRGIEISVQGSSVILKMLLPTSDREIGLYYSLIEEICKVLGTNTFKKNNLSVSVKNISKCMNEDIMKAENLLNYMYTGVVENQENIYKLFTVTNPLSLGKNEFEYIQNNLENLGTFLNAKQDVNSYYSIPKQFEKHGRKVCLYQVANTKNFIIPNIDCVNKSHQNEDVYLVMLNKAIRYEDFMSNVKQVNYYDANNFKLSLTDEKVEDLIKKYNVQI